MAVPIRWYNPKKIWENPPVPNCNKTKDKSTLGPPGRFRSVYKSDFERLFWESIVKTDKWPSRSRSMTTIFNTGRENPKKYIWSKFDDSTSNSDKLLHGQANFPRILSQNGQNDLEGQG